MDFSVENMNVYKVNKCTKPFLCYLFITSCALKKKFQALSQMEVNAIETQGSRYQKDVRWFFSRAITTVPESYTKIMRMAILQGESYGYTANKKEQCTEVKIPFNS